MFRIHGVRLNVFFHDLTSPHQVHRTHRIACSKLQGTADHLLDIFASFNLSNITAILCDNLLLVWNILKPVAIELLVSTKNAMADLVDTYMYSVREPRSSPSMVNGDKPAKIKTGARPVEALWIAAPRPEVPTST